MLFFENRNVFHIFDVLNLVCYIRHEGRKVVRNILILLRRKWMLPYFLFPVLQEGSILTFKYVQEQQKMVYSHSASGAADSSLTLA